MYYTSVPPGTHLDGWRPIAVVRPSDTSGMVNPDIHPILTDHLGTPRKVLDARTGQTRWDWDAKQPFGHQTPNETPTAGLPAFVFDLRFPVQRYDEATGLFQNGFRDYHAGLGRYVQSDPLGLEAGWNTYGYVNSNPAHSLDPFRLSDNYLWVEGPNYGEAGVLPFAPTQKTVDADNMEPYGHLQSTPSKALKGHHDMKRYKNRTLTGSRPLIFFMFIMIFFPFKTEYVVYREAHGEKEIVKHVSSPFWWTYKPQTIERNGLEFFIESSGGQVFWIPLATKKYTNNDRNLPPESYPPIGDGG